MIRASESGTLGKINMREILNTIGGWWRKGKDWLYESVDTKEGRRRKDRVDFISRQNVFQTVDGRTQIDHPADNELYSIVEDEETFHEQEHFAEEDLLSEYRGFDSP